MSEVTFRILDQRLEKIENTGIIIHLYGLTVENKSVYCKVLNYQPYCWLELPSYINWSAPKVGALIEHIQKKLHECPPDVMKFEIKKLALYSVTRPFLRINFKTEDTMTHLKNTLRYKWKIEGFNKEFEPNAFKLHEQNIPTLIKFGIERKLDMAGWVTVKSIHPKDLPKDYSYCDYSVYTMAKWVKKADIPGDVLVDPLICSFDIELHSKNRKSSSPAPEIPENVITMVSLTFGRLTAELENWDTYVITLYSGDKEPSGKYKATVINCKGSEKKLLVEFTKLIKKMKPDIITGYNINGFDWGALIKRAEINEVKNLFFKMGKLKYEKDYLKDDSWESNAKGRQEIVYVKLNGVFNFDMFPEIKFNHNLPMYKLGYVAEKFLGKDESKEDMPYQQMFALFEMIEVLERSLENCETVDVKTAKKLIISKVDKEELIDVPGMTNHVLSFYKDLKTAKSVKSVTKVARNYMLLLLKYVIQDARICPALMKFLNSLTSLWENANVSKCPPNYIYEKGQQIKVLAQYLEKAHWRNFVIPYYTKPKNVKEEDDSEDDDKKNYQGATVLKVMKGLYKDIAILDFKSLYPSIMITYNICHSTFRPNDDNRVKDEDCHIAEWSEHIRCQHDPEFKGKKKRKGDSVYCGDHKYRFIKQTDESKKGLLPLLLEELLTERKRVKKQMFVEETKWKELKLKSQSSELTQEEQNQMILANRKASVLDARQLAVKISANSAYGFCGALTGYFPLVSGAASVTYYGREAIKKTITMVEAKFPPAEVIYGDSVTGDTPLLLKKDGIIYIKTIEELGEEWHPYEEFKANESNRKEKQQSKTAYYVWTDEGWSLIKRVIRHKCNKKIYRVNTRFGCVDVTKDHSLLDTNKNIIKPTQLKIYCKNGDNDESSVLLSSFPTKFNSLETLDNKITEDEAWVWGLFFANGSCGVYNSWALNNQNRQYLEKAQQILNNIEPMTFEICCAFSKYCMKSSDVYKLIPQNSLKYIVEKYNSLFYDKDKQKIVPIQILNGSQNIRQYFLKGYYCGDGDKTSGKSSDKSLRFSCKSKIGAMGLYYICKSLNHNIAVNIRQTNIYDISSSKETINYVNKIIKISERDVNDFVYDLETECGRFHAGVGELIVKNTDSVFVDFCNESTSWCIRIRNGKFL